jgi:Ca2+-binding RTX toxin-like protein
MSTISLSANYIFNSAFLGYGHLQVVYNDGTSPPTELEVDAPATLTLGQWVISDEQEHALYTPGMDFPDTYAIVEIDLWEGQDVDAAWQILLDTRNQLYVQYDGTLNYNYNQNSNSYANTLLAVIGADASDYTPDLDQATILGFPGETRNVLSDPVGGTPPASLSLTGGNGNDVIATGSGSDKLFGGGGDDSLFGGQGEDILSGDSGDDILFDAGGGGIFNGGEGRDFLHIAADTHHMGSNVNVETTIDLVSEFITIGFQGDTNVAAVFGIEGVIGSSGVDTFIVDLDTTTYLAGMEGDDVFEIDNSGDSLGRGGPTVVWGGDGSDTYSFASTAAILVVHIPNISAENFHLLDLGNEPSLAGLDLNAFDAVIVNPDEVDVLRVDGVVTGERPVNTLTISDPVLPTGSVIVSIPYVDVASADGVPSGAGLGLTEIEFERFGTLIGYTGVTQWEVVFKAEGYTFDGTSFVQEYDGEDWKEEFNPNDAAYVSGIYAVPEGASSPVDYSYIKLYVFVIPTAIDYSDQAAVEDVQAPWFIVGGYVDFNSLISNENYTFVLDDADPAYANFLNDYYEDIFPVYIRVSLLGSSGNDLIDGSYTDLYGGQFDNDGNYIIAGDGDDIVYDGAGDDEVFGGSGSDTFFVGDGDNSFDGGAGNDEISYAGSSSGVVVDVEAPTNNSGYAEGDTYVSIEKVTGSNYDDTLISAYASFLAGGDGNDSLFAGAGNDLLFGGIGNDRLFGGLGSDTLSGGAGDDTYFIDSSGDIVGEANAEGHDTLVSSFDLTLGNSLEDLILTGAALSGTGNSLANAISGNELGNHLQGLDGNDSLEGNGGIDSLYGGVGNDLLFGGTGNDTLDGDNGNDTMVGGAGSDTYAVNSTSDVLDESIDGGVDLVRSLISWTLAANFENLSLTGSSAISASGNFAANILTGNVGVNTLDGLSGNDDLFGWSGNDVLVGGDGDDTLDGGTGNDSLSGGNGNDLYVVDSAADTAIESTAGGTDTVQSSVAWTLAVGFENLLLFGSITINGTGNTLSNSVTGNSAANTLIGLNGDDSLYGAAGSDVLQGDDGDDVLYGSTGNDTLSGGSGSDLLDGGFGNDNLAGGAGDDVYVVDSATDTVTESSGSGTDTIQASRTTTLAFDVENLVLMGTSNFNGTGTAVANSMTGNAGDNYLQGLGGDDVLSGGLGNDRLDGGSGNDTLIGSDGDDVYTVDSTVDVISESTGGGLDRIESSVTWTLASAGNVENLTLTGTASVSGTGNSSANTIVGNSVTNSLFGGSGNDALQGGAGNDTIIGGGDADHFVFTSGNNGTDTITDFNQLDGGAAEGDILAFQGLLVGTFAYVGSSAFSGGSDNSEARVSGSQLLVDTDGNGTTNITVNLSGLSNASQLSTNDFLWA